MTFRSGIALLVFLLTCLQAQNVSAQLELMPIPRLDPKSGTNQFRLTEDTTPVALPFWDDFATSDGVPDTNLWVNSNNVHINATIGIDPPSYKVATFDGFDEFGNPYDPLAGDNGPTDSLTSRRIDLTLVPASQQNSLFLSFFWQIEGLGELPDSEDRLLVQFKDDQGEWVTKKEMVGGDMTNNTTFFQEIIPIDSSRYYHDKFQFRFQSIGNQTGSFDNWHIDYVFLNTNRDSQDTFYFDRTVTSQPTTIFDDLYAIPIDHFLSTPGKFVDSARASIFNLENPGGFQVISFSALLKNQKTGKVIDTTDSFNNITYTAAGNPVASPLVGQEKE